MDEDKDDPVDLTGPETRSVYPSSHVTSPIQPQKKLAPSFGFIYREAIKKLEPWLNASGHRGSFLTALLVTSLGLIASLIHPVLGAIVIALASFFLLASPSMMVVCLTCFPLLTSLNTAIFWREGGSLGVQAILILGSFVAVLRMMIFQAARPGRLCVMLALVGFAGGLFGALTSTAPGETISSAFKFVVPLMPLAFWADQLGRRGLGLGPSTYAFAGVLAAISFGSLIVLLTGQGQTLNKVDFQGLLWHPQTCGLLLGLACLFSALLPRLPKWLRGLWFAIAFGLMLMSWTRTAFVALVFAALALALSMLWQHFRPRIRYGNAATIIATFGVVASLALGSILYASNLKPAEYALETSTELFSEEAYAGARTFALYRSYANFAKKPVAGIGFGVPSDPRLLDPVFARETTERIKMGVGSEVLPDKGNAFLAALEENGVLGGVLWLSLFAYCLALAVRSGPVALAIGTYLTFSNLAEATLFSLGGIGMILWVGMIAGMSVKQVDLNLSAIFPKTNKSS